MINRCLKAPSHSIEDIDLYLHPLPYPVLGSFKIDGFRCLIDTVPKTSSMKNQPNPFVFSELSKPELNGLDGELVIGKPNSPDTFNQSTGELRRLYGTPDFTFYVFDSFINQNWSYAQRWLVQDKSIYLQNPRVRILEQRPLYSPEEVIDFTKYCIAEGYEGSMIRTLTGRYKQGRATYKELNIFKRKPLTDTEATIIGFMEKLENLNPAFLDEMGYMKRASDAVGKVPAGTLGSFVLKSPLWPKPFTCTGRLNDMEKQEIWNNQAEYLGKMVTFKYQQYGSISGPRQPIFHRFYTEL